MEESGDMQTKRPPEDEVDSRPEVDIQQQREDEAIKAAENYQSSILSHSETIKMLLVIGNLQTGETFKLGVVEETIMDLKLKIEESQGIEFAEQIILYNGKPISDDGTTEQLIGPGTIQVTRR